MEPPHRGARRALREPDRPAPRARAPVRRDARRGADAQRGERGGAAPRGEGESHQPRARCPIRRGDRAPPRGRRARRRGAPRDRAHARRRALAAAISPGPKGRVPGALRRVLHRSDARRRRRRGVGRVRSRRHALRQGEPAPPRAARRVPGLARADDLAPRGFDEPLRGGAAGSLRHRARGAVRHAGALRRARALPGDRARHERERRDPLRRAARGHPDGQPPEDARGARCSAKRSRSTRASPASLGDALPSIEACADALARADVRAATAKLATELRLAFPTVVDEPVARSRRGAPPAPRARAAGAWSCRAISRCAAGARWS